MPQNQLLHALSDAAILTDPVGVVCGWNESATQLFGWTAAEMIGRPVVDRFPLAARSEVSEYIRHLVDGDNWDGEIEDYRKDGSRIRIETHIHPVHDASAKTIGILSVSRHISRERVSEMERMLQDHYAADILNSMSAHVAVLGPDGRIREVNRAWERFAEENTPGGLAPPSTEVGVDYVGLCRACVGEKSEEATPAADGIEDVLRGKRSFFVMEYPCDSPTEKRWFAMYVTPLATKGGAVVAHYDITARKQAELAVATQSRRTELALTAAHMGVWTIDLATGTIDWSAEVYKIAGVSEFDGRLESWNRLVHPDDLPQMQLQFEEALDRRMPFIGEFRIVRPGGEVRWLANVAHVECDPTGRPVSVVGTVQDITVRKRSEWALKGYNQILELIAAGADLHKILVELSASSRSNSRGHSAPFSLRTSRLAGCGLGPGSHFQPSTTERWMVCRSGQSPGRAARLRIDGRQSRSPTYPSTRSGTTIATSRSGTVCGPVFPCRSFPAGTCQDSKRDR